MPNSPPKILVQYTLGPLAKDGRNCLVCNDVEGMERVVLEWVEFYYGGSPWQKITRKSDDIFVLVENDIIKWPALERITAARFQVHLKDNQRARHITLRPSTRSVGERDGARPVIEEWLMKRKFMEIVRVMANLWHSLEILSTQAALLMEWQQELEDDFAAARVFLQPTSQQAGSYPCSHAISCGCRHSVIFESPDDVSAVCDCEEGGCDPIFLPEHDLQSGADPRSAAPIHNAALGSAKRFDRLWYWGNSARAACILGRIISCTSTPAPMARNMVKVNWPPRCSRNSSRPLSTIG